MKPSTLLDIQGATHISYGVTHIFGVQGSTLEKIVNFEKLWSIKVTSIAKSNKCDEFSLSFEAIQFNCLLKILNFVLT